MWLETIEQCQVVLPPRRKRLVVLAFSGLLGVLTAYTLAPVVSWAQGEMVIMLLALMAGISALWSP